MKKLKHIIKKIVNISKPTKKLIANINYLYPNNRLEGKNILITGGEEVLGSLWQRSLLQKERE